MKSQSQTFKMLMSMTLCVTFLASIFGTEALNITEVCPYNTFCSSGPLKSLTPDGIHRSCCESCLCSEDCELFGKCCFDFEPKNLETIHKCYTQDELYNSPRNIAPYSTKEGFVIINTCPVDNDRIVSHLEMLELDDFVPVSRKADGRIYVNRKCALCNGVEDVVEWNLRIVNCAFVMIQKYNSSDHFEAAVLKRCRLYSTPPLSIYENVLKYECAGTRAIVKSCLIAESEKNTEVINGHDMKCKTEHKIPFVYLNRRVYQNPYCLRCVKDEEYSEDICEDSIKPGRAGLAKMTLFLNAKVQQKQMPKCGASEMFDPSQETCIHLYCPRFYLPTFGVCQEIAGNSSIFGIKLAFSVVIIGELLDSEKLGSFLLRFFKNKLNSNEHISESLTRCNLKTFGLRKSDENDNIILIFISVPTTSHCTLYNVLSDVKTLATVQTFNFPSVDSSLSNITLLETFDKSNPNNIYVNSPPSFLESFFVTNDMLEECPSVEINVRQHPLQNRIENHIKKRKLKSDGNMLKLCVKDYLALISSSGNYLVSKTILLICIIITVCRLTIN